MSEENKIDDGGAAFPCLASARVGTDYDADYGMSRRDYFAAKAMQALISNPRLHEDLALRVRSKRSNYETITEAVAGLAVAQADALLAELKK